MAIEDSCQERSTEANEGKSGGPGKDKALPDDMKKSKEEVPGSVHNSAGADAQPEQRPSVATRIGGNATLASDAFIQGFPRAVGGDGFLPPWAYYPPTVSSTGDMASANSLRPDSGSLAPPVVPFFYPAAIPSFFSMQEQNQQQGGIYAVPMFPYFGPVPGFPPCGLVPLSLNIPLGAPALPEASGTAGSQGGRQVEGGRGVPANREVVAQEGPRHRHGGPGRPGQGLRPEPRQVVRRFRVGFQLDLLLILKLAVVVVVFNHDGSKDRLMLLLFLAVVVYLYQTGALAPVLRWISQCAQRAMMPPQQQGPVHPEGQAGPELQANGAEAILPANTAENAPAGDNRGPNVQDLAVTHTEGEGGAAAEAEHPAQGPNWWGFFKEVQMILVGFVTSLLPGYHQHVE